MTTRKNERTIPTLALSVAAAALVAGALILGGRDEPAPAPGAVARAEATSVERFVFAGSAGSEAVVTRAAGPAGGEVLHGEVELRLGARARRRVIEDVLLDARGRLVRAEITVHGDRGADPERHLSLDAVAGTVRLVGASGTTAFRAPTDAPWIYAPEALAGHPMPTPIAAWVARRAAALAPAARAIEPASQRAPLVSADQIAVPTEAGTTVVVGGEGADVDELFVAEVRSPTHGITLLRSPRLRELQM
jgi:hypothetical protein